MIVSSKSWEGYIKKLRRINNAAADYMQKYIDKNGTENRKELVSIAYAVISKYGTASAALAAKLYDEIAELSGVNLAAAEIQEPASYKDVAIAINGALKKENPQAVSNAVSVLVKRASADTILYNASRKRDSKRAQFAWIPSGDTCPFCLTLSSKGWQNISKNAMKNGHAEHIHPNCDCNYIVRFSENDGLSGYNPAEYKKMYDQAEGINWKEKVNYLRRKQYEENKDAINAQKRAAYAERKQRENERTANAKN